MPNELVQVPFHGDIIEAVQDEQGNVWVPIKRPCENLGVQAHPQAEKLKEKAWAVTRLIRATGPDGKSYEMFALRHDCLPMWLATIDTSRVKAEIRPKLELYQKEAAKALADWFFGRKEPARATAPASPFQAIRAMIDALEAQEQRLFSVESQVGNLVDIRDRATRELKHVERSDESAEPLTARDKVNQLVRAYCKATGTEHGDVWGRLYREMFYRCDFNAQVRARNKGRRALDEVEDAGLMPDLFAIASEMLKF